jgi:hypothetical protein
MPKKVTPKAGDVFMVALDEVTYGVGQIAGKWGPELYIMLFPTAYNTRDINVLEVVGQLPILAALSLDALFWNGQWTIIGVATDNLINLPQPAFKVNYETAVLIESRDRSISRRASLEEQELLKYRTVFAPIRLENALKAYHGLGEWHPNFDELSFEYALKSSQFLKCT